MASIFHSELSKDLSLILNGDDVDVNVIIQVGENQNTKEFRAHSVILRARCQYFKIAFSSEWIRKKDNMIMFNKPNIAPTVFEMILKYIYTGELDLTKQTNADVLRLLIASDELLLEGLFKYIQDYLIRKQSSWVQKNSVLVLHTVLKLESCKKLQNYCLESICANPQPFITSNNSPSLNRDILYDLLKRDDLQIEEVDAWDFLIKWGIEQTPDLRSNNSSRSKWDNKNYEALKKTLNQFIPLIRFSEINSADFFDKVHPYRAIFPDHVYYELEAFYYKGALPKTTTLPPRTGKVKIESKIIKSTLFSTIINWINRKDANSTRNKTDPFYGFDLFYRKSCDGNGKLQNICRPGAILILIKVKYSDKIFGGYNPIGWSNKQSNYNHKITRALHYLKDQCFFTTESFIFSFENDEDTKNMKISRVINPSYAINYYSGISFGCDFNLKLEDDYLYLTLASRYYENNLNLNNNTNQNQYEVEEIEAFSVFKK